MKLKSLGMTLLYWAVAMAGVYALCFLAGFSARPDMSTPAVSRSEEELRAAEKARTVSINLDNPPRVQVDVDYSRGQDAPWYPKGQSPILKKLFENGKLPPLTQRVGPEPVVMKGCDGIGKYGGTWIRVGNSSGDGPGVMNSRLSYTALIRWSPQGHPIVPHLAKSFRASKDNREFVFMLRKGVKWSDGHPFTADDIIYWWEHESCDKKLSAQPHGLMKVGNKYGTIRKLGKYRVKFTFPEPNGLFLAKMATSSSLMLNSPVHYRRKFHPTLGDKKLIADRMSACNLANPRAVYGDVKKITNPEHPRLWPWIYRTYKANPPQTFVRNPYYWAVDKQGNQLPYVDRILYEVKSQKLVAVTASNGEITLQARHIRYDDYTLLMSQRKKYDYDVYHWYPGDRSLYVICPNLNRRIEPDKPETALKHELLNNKRFRQALSLAINRQAIIDAELNGQATPSQVAPSQVSLYYEPSLPKSFVEYDPGRANRMLDEIGLKKRDAEGYRTFKDGTRMCFIFNYCNFTGAGSGQFVVDDWSKVGVRVILRERSRALFYSEKLSRQQDFCVWIGNDEYFPIIQPLHFLPVPGCFFATAYTRWFDRGGVEGDPKAARKYGCIAPPNGHPFYRAMEFYNRAAQHSDPKKQADIFREVLKIAAENVWTITISTPAPVLGVVKNGFRNVPRQGVYSWDFQTPGNFGIETFYFDKSQDSPGTVQQIAREIITPTLPDDIASAGGKSGSVVGAILRYGFLAVAILLVVLLAARHPYIGRRLLIMIPTLLIISVIVFFVIQLPPGDFLSTHIMQLEEAGDDVNMQAVEDLKEQFFLDDPVSVRYMRWLGLVWFTSFDARDSGLLQGNMGRSMQDRKSVNDIVGDRITLTVLISLGTILFTWAIAIPIGIYSAVKQYSIGDYVFTFLGFVGMCIPAFLLALLLMYVSAEWLGIPVSGLFSSRYGAQPEWTWGKVVDLLKHIWIPVVVLGAGGTAGMIRVMRANLLDELKKPYVTTARAKGVRPIKLLFKYPVRMALNPFISGIGGLFPQLVSGGAIVAMVLSLPTVGPLMLDALMSEDMYLAGSMLMVLSLLGVVGTLISDLMLLWLDPRIRFKGGGK